MSARGDERRKLLGTAALEANREAARNAPPWTPDQVAALLIILRKPASRRSRVDD
jgi:hypothetical protein